MQVRMQIKHVVELRYYIVSLLFYTRPNLVLYFNLKIQGFWNVTMSHSSQPRRF